MFLPTVYNNNFYTTIHTYSIYTGHIYVDELYAVDPHSVRITDVEYIERTLSGTASHHDAAQMTALVMRY